MEQGEIILYQPDEAVKLEVRLFFWRHGKLCEIFGVCIVD